MKEHIDFNDNKVPIGKRKQAYIKWAVSKGTDLISAKRQANKKFGFEMKEGLLAEAEKYKEKTFDYGRFSFQKKEVGVKYDFSGCDDQVLEHLEKTSEKLNEEIKARKDFLKTIQPGVACFDENGIQLFPPAKTSTSTVITILK